MPGIEGARRWGGAGAGARRVLSLCLLLGLWPAAARPAVSQETRVGPARGALVVVGGAMRDPAIVERFLELAGGRHQPIVVIPTAAGLDRYDRSFGGLEPFLDAGADHVTLLHTDDREVADSEAFVAPIREAAGVWFTGGRQWRLADSYLGTRTERELWALLDRGGVIGGSSAGATIQGSYLARGDTRSNTVMMGDHEEGFGFLRATAIDQHLLRRNRQFDLIEVIEAHPELLGIGIDENTAIVVRGDGFEVMGESYVAIYDHESMVGDRGRFYLLAAGDRFDLADRSAYRATRRMEPLERVEARRWPPR